MAGVPLRRQDPRQPGLRVAESTAGRGSPANLLRGPRGPSPWTDRVGGEADRLPLASRSDRRPVAVDETCRGVAGLAPRESLTMARSRLTSEDVKLSFLWSLPGCLRVWVVRPHAK